MTHSHKFAAAISSSGLSDLIRSFGDLGDQTITNQFYYELGQGRMGTALWEHPEVYIQNSPIFSVQHVSTPLLIIGNKLDFRVPWMQGVEFFTALRRLGKPSWLLQYDKGGHGVFYNDIKKDYLIRSTQFFDHYLKDAPAPVWMTRGIFANRKGIDTGLELDTNTALPQESPLLTDEAKKKAKELEHKKPVTVTIP